MDSQVKEAFDQNAPRKRNPYPENFNKNHYMAALCNNGVCPEYRQSVGSVSVPKPTNRDLGLK